MSSGLNNNNNLSSPNNAWLDDLLVKDQTGKLQSWHKAQDVMVTVADKQPLTNKVEDDIEIAENILPTIYVAPQDDSFYLLSLGGKPQDKAKHIFHPDDERHLQEAALKLTSDDSKKYSLEKIVAKLLEKQALNLDSANRELFTSILYDFFRNRKNSIIIREYLSKITVNNKALDAKILDIILSVAKTIKANIEAEGGLVVKASELEKKKVLNESLVDINKVIAKTQPTLQTDFNPIVAPINVVPKELPKVVSETQKLEAIEIPKPILKSEAKEPEPKLLIESKVTAPEVQIPAPSKEKEKVSNISDLPKVTRPQSINVAKPKLSDVTTQIPSPKTPPTKHILVGPVDELANMNIDNFRRLGTDASARAQRIYEKIAILEKESVTKKAAGIAAWRQSPVYLEYLDLGATSLVQGKEISNLIQERLKTNGKSLSLDEFNTIGDLNKLLRF